jgi:dsDNA-specific endonuclease/ATPase MutS2
LDANTDVQTRDIPKENLERKEKELEEISTRRYREMEESLRAKHKEVEMKLESVVKETATLLSEQQVQTSRKSLPLAHTSFS